MKRNEILLAVFLLMVGILISGCSIDDATIEIPTGQTTPTGDMTFTASVEAKSPATRSVDADGVTTWVVNEKIAVYYQKTNNSYGTATANVDEVNEGKAIISATLTDAKDDTEVKFVYPATLTNATGDDIDAAKLATQHGTIADISANFDAATATATLKTDGTICGTTATINFTNRVLIGKFTPKFSGVAINAISTLTVTDGTQTYTVTPSSGTFGTTGIYVAMLPVSSKRVRITAANASQTYVFSKSVTLEAGKLYNNLAFECYLQDIDLATLTGDCTALDGQVLTGTLDGSTKPYKISIADGATVTLNNATIDGFDPPKYTIYDIDGWLTMMQTDPQGLLDLLNSMNENLPKYLWAGLNCIGDATIILADGTTNTVRGFYKDYPGIHIPKGKTLTIQGSTGKLISNSNGTGISQNCGSGAGIGGGVNIDCGHIRIEGGDITTTSFLSAGIGGGGLDINATQRPSCDGITITGGKIEVTAVGLDNGAAGIGSGTYGDCGDISISGGTINSDGNDGAAIGSGWCGSCGDIIISGCKIYAASSATSIGCGKSYGTIGVSCGDITITTDITEVTAYWKMKRGAFPFGDIEGKNGLHQCGKVMFGNQEVDIDNWSNTVGESYGGLKITVTNEFSKWILTPDT